MAIGDVSCRDSGSVQMNMTQLSRNTSPMLLAIAVIAHRFQPTRGLRLLKIAGAIGFSSLFALSSALAERATGSRAAQATDMIAISQPHPDAVNPPLARGPENEFHIARLAFDTNAHHGWGPGRPWWRIDWPEAEMNFINGLQRYTVIESSADSTHITLEDAALFDYPWLFAQQVGRWQVTDQQASNLGEYLQRGGFMLADDMHGPDDWATFTEVMQRALPGHSITDILPDDPIMAVLYSLDQRTQIPGKRHIMSNDGNGNVQVSMPHSPPRWRGIKDADDSWVVAINFNMDMGDSWEHADDPGYPLNMTSLGYQLGINYILYAMTH